MAKYLVRCTYEIEVEMSDTISDHYFHIQENGCPGTGEVGLALDQLMEKHDDASTCWACACQGKNEIIKVLVPKVK